MAAHKGQINMGMRFDVDKSSLQQVKAELQSIQKMTVQEFSLKNANMGFKEAQSKLIEIKREANAVQAALDRAFNTNLGSMNVTKFDMELKKADIDLKAVYNDFRMMGATGIQAFQQLSSSVLTSNLQLKQTHKILDNISQTMFNTAKWGLASSVFNNMTSSIQKAWNYTVKLDTSLNDIRIVSEKSADQMERFAKQANAASQRLGASTRDYTNAALIYYQQGLSDEESQARAEVTVKAANVTRQSGEEVSEQLTAIWNGYKVNAQEAELYIDKVAKVAATTAADLEEMATAMSKVASAANSAGVDIDRLNGMLSTVISVTREAPETIGTSFRTIFARLGDLKLGKTDEDGVDLGSVSGQLQSLGIQILDQEGNMRDMGDIIEDVAKKWEGWTQAQRQAAAIAMAGQRQYSRLIALFDNWDMYTKAVNDSKNAVGELQKEQDIYMESTAAHLQKLSTAWERVYDAAVDNGKANGIIDVLTGLTNGVANWIEAMGGGTNVLLTLGSIATTVFSKQIAASLNTTISNFEAAKFNAQQLANQLKELENLNNSTNGGDAGTKARYEKRLEMQRYVGSMSTDQITQANSLIDKYGEAESIAQQYQVEKEQAIQIIMQTMAQANKEIDEHFAQKAIENEGSDEFGQYSEEYLKNVIEDKQEMLNIFAELDEAQKKFAADQGTEQETESFDLLKSAIKGAREELDALIERQDISEATRTDLVNARAGLQQIDLRRKNPLEDRGNKTALVKAGSAAAGTFKEIENNAKVVADVTNREMTNAFANIQLKAKNAKKDVDDFFNGIKRTSAIDTVVKTVGAFGQLAAAVQAFKNLGDIWDNEDLSDGEKVLQTVMAISTALPMLLTGLSGIRMALIALAPAEAAATGGATAMWAAILGPVGLVIAGIAAVGIAIYSLVKAYNEDADAAKEAAESAKNLKKEYEELRTSVQQFQDTLEQYKDAKRTLQDLDSTTQEYQETLEKANESAKKLLETNTQLQAIATRDSNGLIIFDEEGLKKYEAAQKNALRHAEAVSAGGQLWANQAQMKSNTTDALRKLDFQIDSTTLNQLSDIYKKQGTIIAEDVDNLTTASDSLKESIKKDIAESNSTIIKLMESNGELQKSNKYLASVITGDYLEENNEDYQSRDDIEKTAISNILAKTEAGVAERNKGLYKYYKEEEEEKIQLGKNNSFLWWNGPHKDAVKDLAKRYAESKNWTYTGSDTKGANFKESESKVSVDEMIDWVATEHANKSLNKINELQNYKGAAKITDAIKILGRDLDTQYGTKDNQLYQDLLYYISGTDKNIKSLDQLSPEQVEALKTQMLGLASSLEGYDWKSLGFESAQKFVESWNAEIDSQYNPLEYYKKEYKRQSDIVKGSNDALGVLSKGDATELDEDQLAFITQLEQKYTELGEIQDRTSHEYLSLLRQIKEQAETNAFEALRHQKELQEQQLETSMGELDKLEEEYKKLKEEGKELSEDDELYINIKAKTDEIEQTLKDLEETDHSIKVQIDADLASDVKDAFGIADELGQLKDAVHDDLTYTFEEAQELIDKGYGEMFNRAKETAENTIQVNKDVLNSFIDDKQAEIEADRQAKINQLEQQKVLLQAQRQALISKLNALKEAASAETAVDAATAMEKVANSENEYRAATEALNAQLKDEAEGATEDQNINAELYNQLGDMYETDAKNEEQAEVDATNNQAANIQTRINNVRSLHQAYSSLATQIRASESGVNTPFSAGGVSGGSSTGTTGSTEVKAGTQTAKQIDIQALKEKTQNLFNNNRSQYNATINALIKSTEAQINSVEAQIGAADAGIAALKSAGTSLDKAQRDARPGGSKSGGGGSEADHIDRLEEEADRYHEIDTQIQLIDKHLSLLQSQQDKLFGKNLLDNLSKQLSALDKQIDNYNKKLDIAKDEAWNPKTGLQQLLASQGVSFNSDGTISNYVDAFNRQQQHVNDIIDAYNGMSAEAQKNFKQTVEDAKEDFDTFKTNLDRYDELVSDIMPDLEQQIQDALDKQIEINVQKFNYEIEIRLDMSKAERDWNEFKKKVIDGIQDSDILGNARARLTDYGSYYKSDGTGVIQRNTQHVNDIVNELRTMENGGRSSIYGDNETQALEDLKTYYEQLMSDLKDIRQLEDDMHQSYLKEIDEVNTKLNDQVKMYEQVQSLINHNMKVIQLIGGDDSYSQLRQYYQMQEDNYNKSLDFQRQQVDFWKQQMDAMEEGSEEWEKAKKNWIDAVNTWEKTVENAIENIRDKFENAINDIFDRLNDKVTNGWGLEYVNEEWGLINKNADQYLDTINAMYGIRDLEKKYLDAIDQTDSVSAQRKLNALMEEEVKALKDKDRLTQYDVERAEKKYQIALAQIALEEAQQNKSNMRLRRDSQGNYTYQFVADENAVGDAEDNLDALRNELYNFDLARYRDNLDQIYEIWDEYQQKMAEAAMINDPEERAERELLLNEQYGELINGLVEQNETVRTNLHESAFTELADLYEVDLANFQTLSDEEQDVILSDMIPQWESGVQQMADVFAGEGGFIPTCEDAMNELAEVTQEYQDDLNELQSTAGFTYSELENGIDQVITDTQELIYDNTELINKYGDELQAVQLLLAELKDLTAQYQAAKDAAIAATEAAYKYWQFQNGQAAAAAGNGGHGSGSGGSGGGSGSGGSGGSGSGGSGGGVGGKDGQLSVGDTATYSGKYYYDSYGSSPTGSKYSGVGDGIVIDRITNNPYGIHIHSADGRYGDLGWIKRSQLSGYDTGGYTGQWSGNTGKLALLHQKELVLNAQDTQNILNAVEIMRSVSSAMLSKVAGLMAGTNAPIGGAAAGQLEQDVHIEANFPNVTSSNEIEEAINNLVNIASQRAYKG